MQISSSENGSNTLIDHNNPAKEAYYNVHLIRFENMLNQYKEMFPHGYKTKSLSHVLKLYIKSNMKDTTIKTIYLYYITI